MIDIKMVLVYLGIILFWCKSYSQQGQVGINTLSPHSSAIFDINSTNKGVLFPRFSISNILDANPTTNPADGLLAYKSNSSGSSIINQKGLVHWNESANNNNGSWDRHLYFKETPKTAIIGFSGNDLSLLTDMNAGYGEYLQGNSTSLIIKNSGNMPGLSVRNIEDYMVIELMSGTYLIEATFTFSAPDPGSRGTVLQNNYYNMGYFYDFVIYNAHTNSNVIDSRVENGTLSLLNTKHTIPFIATFELSGTDNFHIYPYIGRRSGSSHNHTVNLIVSDSYFKITKLK